MARLLALAYHFQELLDTGAVETQAELAKLTRARVTQITNLLYLAPDVQEQILFLATVTEGQPTITERHLRQVLKTVVWSEQRERWAAIWTVQWQARSLQRHLARSVQRSPVIRFSVSSVEALTLEAESGIG